MDWLDIVCKVAMVIIAIVNVIFAYFVFNKNKNRELTNKLILDYSIEHFYKYFDELEEELEKIKNKNISNTDKKQLEKNIQSLGRVLEHKFIDLFLYVNGTLHENIKHDIDDMVGVLTESLFDEGINLSVETKFNEKIATPIVTTKSKILKLLFDSSK